MEKAKLGLRNLEIPVLKKETWVDKTGEVDGVKQRHLFFGFNDKSKKEDYIKQIKEKTSGYEKAFMTHDFQKGVELASRKWSLDDYVMIYENTDCSDMTKLISDGEVGYECALWVVVEEKD